MYNATSNIWFIANLSQPRGLLAATSSTNKIFFGGGWSNSSSGYSNTVDIFDIPLPPPPPPLPPIPSNIGTSPLSPPPFSSAPTSGVPSTLPSTPSGVSGPTQPAPYSPQHSNISTGTVPSSVNSPLIGGLIGSIVGTLLVGGGIVVLVILLRRKRKQKKSTQIANKDDKTKPVEFDENGATLESRRQTVTSESDTTTTTLTYPQTVTETLKSLTPGQIPLNELEIGREIGNGNYGRVCIGKWKNIEWH
jgi:hypothetical protein